MEHNFYPRMKIMIEYTKYHYSAKSSCAGERCLVSRFPLCRKVCQRLAYFMFNRFNRFRSKRWFILNAVFVQIIIFNLKFALVHLGGFNIGSKHYNLSFYVISILTAVSNSFIPFYHRRIYDSSFTAFHLLLGSGTQEQHLFKIHTFFVHRLFDLKA